MAGGPISWKAKKQSLTSISSMESEFYTATLATLEAIWLRAFLSDIGYPNPPIPLYIDNASCEAFICNDVTHARTKHIDMKFHFVRQTLQNNEISLHHVSGTSNPTNVLTKALSPQKHVTALLLLGM
jgi:hypothetical protein